MSRRILLVTLVTFACGRDRPASDQVAERMSAKSGAAPALAPNGYAVAPGAPMRADMSVAASASALSRVGGLEAGEETGEGAGPALPRTDPGAPLLVIRTGNAVIEVDSLARAIERVRQLAQQVGGYVANSSQQGGREQVKSATLQLKIPATAFDPALSGLVTIGKVESVNVTADDVSEEFVDVTARVTNAKRLESRLVELLAKRTGKLQDILAVERELARVREQIERYEGRLRFLKTRAAVSTLTVTVHEPYPVLGTVGRNPLADALKRAWSNLVHVVVRLIEFAGALVPIVILVGAVGIIVWRWRRRSGRQ